MRLKYILPLLLLLPMLSACNNSDDVVEIFTNKTWKLTGIYKGSNDWCMDYWNSEEEKEASDKLFAKAGNFTIAFTGMEDGDLGMGEYSGYATSSGIKGKWEANGKNNKFTIYNQANPNNNEDKLAKAFINGLINAYKYEGDTYNLRIYFEDKERKDKRFLMFHVVN